MSVSRIFNEPFYSVADFDRLFDNAFARTNGQGQVQRQGSGSTLLRPRMDVHEDTKNNTVTATFELPGLKKEDVQIDLHNNVLTVSGESRISSERDEDGYAVQERRYGKFSRSLTVPAGVQSESIKANLENGVLTVTFPKSTPETEAKKITIA